MTNGTNHDLAGTAGAPINPLLGSLTNNGGITMTMALLPGSPALDAGDDTLTGTDQRGFSRKSGFHVDIGAYEESTTVADVTTLASTAISFSSATLNGTVNPKDLPTAAWFQWGTTTSYGNATSVTNLSAVNANLSVTRPLTGLTPGQTYHVQLVASNSAGVVTGNDVTWTNLLPTTYAEAATLIDWTGVPADRRGPLHRPAA